MIDDDVSIHGVIVIYFRPFTKGNNFRDLLRVATYHPPQNSLLFPDFPLTFYSFPYPLIGQKSTLYHFKFWVTLKGKNLLPKGAFFSFKSSPMCLDYLKRKFILSQQSI